MLKEFPIWSETKDSVKAFSLELVEGALARQEELDRRLAAVSQNWSVDRMGPVDRNILRLGAFELLYGPGTPAKVVINEAIELAKKFGTTQSGRFVNGVLDALRKQSEKEDGEEKEGNADQEEKEEGEEKEEEESKENKGES